MRPIDGEALSNKTAKLESAGLEHLIVRCQKCRHWKQHTAVDSEGNLIYLDSGNCGTRETNKDDYCSFAEVRCKDCERYYGAVQQARFGEIGLCDFDDRLVKPSDYCSKGKRREDNA